MNRDRGSLTAMDLLVVLAIVALIIWLARTY